MAGGGAGLAEIVVTRAGPRFRDSVILSYNITFVHAKPESQIVEPIKVLDFVMEFVFIMKFLQRCQELSSLYDTKFEQN